MSMLFFACYANHLTIRPLLDILSAMSNIASKILELLIAGQNAFLNSDVLSLRNRFLFALTEKPRAPKELMDILKQDKSNVAHLAAGLEQDELIEKSVYLVDRRRVRYQLSEKGRESVEAALTEAEERFLNFLDTPQAVTEAEEKIDEVLYLLSFL